ncbi:MAG: sigma-54-dependent Fis family transcriptional regulator [Candidatus Sumerlaeia bacterium]|nr:sigma-54-dependent Fis family transcriptional regulator [Candidatus Sumerlaeia bacterium]
MPTEKRPPRGRVLLVDDERAIRQALSVELGHGGFEVAAAASGPEALALLEGDEFDAVLLDLRMPEMPGEEVLAAILRQRPHLAVVILTAHGDVQSAVQCLRAGAFDYLQKPSPLDELELALGRAIESTRLRTANRELNRRLSSPAESAIPLVGDSAAFREIRKVVSRVAPTDVPVLITGESGTGKEIVARSIVAESDRAAASLFTINCAALSESLVESELFGHERGAFTGANETRPGFFELADGGTIFLDEIGEMTPGLQAKLLRVLQFGEFQRVGGRRTLTSDVRIIAATNRDLEAEMRAGGFREDLFHRISTITIAIPPLRERPEDLRPLVEMIVRDRLPRGVAPPEITPEAHVCLAAHDWPGNVRELENVFIRAAILCPEARIEPGHLPPAIRAHAGAPLPAEAAAADATLEEIERRHILAMLERCRGNKAEAARRLGITKRTLYNKLILYGVHQPGA